MGGVHGRLLVVDFDIQLAKHDRSPRDGHWHADPHRDIHRGKAAASNTWLRLNCSRRAAYAAVQPGATTIDPQTISAFYAA
ncbi:hypothetical protein [Streptomyces sp. NPDC047061]|uniref:hypothetical protein n=1 Tax=Streptomyces sp. NPDC047061 TaxID=3154605 RepID=UPI0033E08216